MSENLQHGHETYDARPAPLPVTADAQRLGLSADTTGGAMIAAASNVGTARVKHAWLYYTVVGLIVVISLALAFA